MAITHYGTPYFNSAPPNIQRVITIIASTLEESVIDLLPIAAQDSEKEIPQLQEAIARFIHNAGLNCALRLGAQSHNLAQYAIQQAMKGANDATPPRL